mmetsp:Transcript_20567/g.55411  ORF Transcript_20567/g.55411 Transcript_20567/m.55411 type:complete len:238 (-) Transcript_20567:955-1668(-)
MSDVHARQDVLIDIEGGRRPRGRPRGGQIVAQLRPVHVPPGGGRVGLGLRDSHGCCTRLCTRPGIPFGLEALRHGALLVQGAQRGRRERLLVPVDVGVEVVCDLVEHKVRQAGGLCGQGLRCVVQAHDQLAEPVHGVVLEELAQVAEEAPLFTRRIQQRWGRIGHLGRGRAPVVPHAEHGEEAAAPAGDGARWLNGLCVHLRLYGTDECRQAPGRFDGAPAHLHCRGDELRGRLGIV